MEDGYVDLGPGRGGLGRHLFEALEEAIPVVGVAKSRFPDTGAAEILRGSSRRPLYITTAGVPVAEAAAGIAQMSGPHRLPTLLQRADHLARRLAI